MLEPWSECCGMCSSGGLFGVFLSSGIGFLDLTALEELGKSFVSLCCSGTGPCVVGGEITLSLLIVACTDELWVVGVRQGEGEEGSGGEKGLVTAGKKTSPGSGLGLGV